MRTLIPNTPLLAKTDYLYLFGADESFHVRGLKCWDLRGGGEVFGGGVWVTAALCRLGAVAICLFDLEPRGE